MYFIQGIDKFVCLVLTFSGLYVRIIYNEINQRENITSFLNFLVRKNASHCENWGWGKNPNKNKLAKMYSAVTRYIAQQITKKVPWLSTR